MIKFFRKIRYDYMGTGKTGKYLKYAIGEIVLVVMGILIALSINNWNHKQKEIEKESISLNNLVLDLEEQFELLEEYILIESNYYENGISILRHYAKHNGFVNMDSIYPKLNSIATRKTFNPINTTFIELKSTGNISLIQNENLKRSIIRYYHELERTTIVVTNNNTNLVDGIYNSILIKSTLYASDIDDIAMTTMNKSIFELEELKELQKTSELVLSNPEVSLSLFNALENRISVALGHKDSYVQLKKETRGLIHLIKLEIDN